MAPPGGIWLMPGAWFVVRPQLEGPARKNTRLLAVPATAAYIRPGSLSMTRPVAASRTAAPGTPAPAPEPGPTRVIR